MSKNIEGVGEVITPSTLKEKILNFWYHYKWHSVAALVVVLVAVVCMLQFCQREEYDAYILYAGSKNIGRTAEDGDVPEIVTINSSLKKIAKDFDGNGEININFNNYYYLSNDEASERDDVNANLLASDTKGLSSMLEHSEYYLMFISKAFYENYHKVGDDSLFMDLTSYASHNRDAEFYAPNAILLSSIDASMLPGLSSLPEDTLICIRFPSVLGGKSKEHNEHFENAKKMLVNLLEIDYD